MTKKELPFELDPRDLPGYQPSPADIRYRINPGKTIELTNGSKDGVKAVSEYISEWVVKLLVPPESIASVAAGEGYGIFQQLYVRHNGEQFTEYQTVVSPNALPLAVPLVGQCIGVHGRSIDMMFSRVAPGATGVLKIEAAIVPGRPSYSWLNRSLSVAGGLGVVNLVAIPAFATKFQIFGPIDMGDIIRIVPASGVGFVQIVPAGGSVPFPFHPLGAFIGYSSANNKELSVGFEIIS